MFRKYLLNRSHLYQIVPADLLSGLHKVPFVLNQPPTIFYALFISHVYNILILKSITSCILSGQFHSSDRLKPICLNPEILPIIFVKQKEK